MPALARRRYPERHECWWHVYYGDIHAGTIALRVGIPHDEDPCGWSCSFYPGSHLGECTNGSAPTFDDARADFEAAIFLSKRTEADLQGWREAQAWAAWKLHRLRPRRPKRVA
jgi:hypothetical protein